jgi:hypothetical protein
MSPDCYKLNPLQRGGTSQDQRFLKALLSTYVQIDERQTKDLIYFADQYATLLAYYNNNNQLDGDWQPFLRADLSTTLARVMQRNYRAVGETYDKYLQNLRNNPRKENYKPIFDIIFSLFWEIERINDLAIFNTPIKADLDREIQGRLNGELKQLIAYYKGGVATNLVDESLETDSTGEAFSFQDVNFVLSRNFSVIWIVKNNEADVVNNWEGYHSTCINPDSSIYGENTWTAAQRIDYSLSFIRAIFNRVYEAYIRLISNAEKYLQRSLEEYANHPPQNALLLTFFQLFSYAQTDLNQISDRHLQFYFEEVLKLKRKPASPDSVHILVELAKNRETYQIATGTELNAGKDKIGKDLIYSVEQELIANTAKIASLKTIFIDSDPVTGGVFDAPVANSKNGLGEALDENNPQWYAFGQLQSGLGANMTMQRSQIGWAIASPILRLRAGKRFIIFRLFFQANSALSSVPIDTLVNCLQVQLSGEKQWIQCPNLDSQNPTAANYVQFQYSNNPELRRIEIKITLEPDVDPVVDYNSTQLSGDLNTDYPVAQFHIKTDAPRNVYLVLRQLQIERITMETMVEELPDLVLQSDIGVLDPTKPFQPFSPQPKVGSTFYIGSDEVFSKPLSSIKFDIQWQGLPTTSFLEHYSYQNSVRGADRRINSVTKQYITISNNDSFKVDVAILQNGKWKPLANSPVALFDSGTAQVSNDRLLNFTLSATSIIPNLEPFTSYNLNTKNGFLRLVLSNPPEAFGHDKYPKVYGEQVIDLARGKALVTLPNEPYTPTIQSICCSYTASLEINFGSLLDRHKGQFFQLHPFGYQEMETANPFLVPSLLIQGALHIGIQDIKPQQTLAILLQIAAGTEDTSIDPPEVVWEYLADNEWRSLDKFILANATNGLLDSGIIQFRIPIDANDDNTILPKGLRWLRAAIAQNYQAIPQLLGVHAQALRATFVDRGNDPEHLALPLKAGSISKLVKSDSAIKTISQPYESFNGKKQEDSQVFYNRVSERLRHKNRAIAIWDYERLILEAFPFIYQVKCLNHTDEMTELAPGSVRIVVVPDMRNKKAGNKFQPGVSNGNRAKIDQFIQKLNCDFVDLKVENPRYEAIKVNCNVAFQEGLDKLFYRDSLATDIDKFLAPWAFEEGRGIKFGGALHQSVILNFVENLPYVDFVTDFILDVYIGAVVKAQVTEAIASTSRSILTSYQFHNIGFNVCQ